MRKYKIALLPGDGVGQEVIECAHKVLKAIEIEAEYIYLDIGWEFWRAEGNPLPKRTIEHLKDCDCALLGAITSKPAVEAELELDNSLRNRRLQYRSPIIQLRQIFDLSSNIRPCKSILGNQAALNENVDITIFRENTEGLYCGVEYSEMPKELYELLSEKFPAMEYYKDRGLHQTAVSLRIMCESKSKKIIRKAFEYARRNGKRKVTVADKPNILRATGGLFVNVARKVAKDFPEIELEEVNIDAICMWLLKNPENFDIIVAENLFGDIISDLVAQLAGGMGFAYSGNIGDNFAVFEPIHGSAPKYAGKNKVNPIATVLAAAFMLHWLGENSKADLIKGAVEKVVSEHRVGTYDMGLNNSNIELTNALIEKIGRS